ASLHLDLFSTLIYFYSFLQLNPPWLPLFESKTGIVHLCCICSDLAETSQIRLCRDHIGPVPAESDSVSAKQYFKECPVDRVGTRPVSGQRLVAKRRLLGRIGTLLSDLTLQNLANGDGTLQLLLAITNDCVSHQLAQDECSAIVIVAFMTRKRNSGSLHPLDLEIEKTLNRIRKSKHMHIGHIGDSIRFITMTDNYEMKLDFSDNPLYESESMENNNRTLKELYPQLELVQSYELKSRLIHLLPKFHCLVGEDPHKHLKEFCMDIPEDYIKIKVFPFSIDRTTKDWLYLQPVICTTWGDMKRMFLEKFFPASRTTTIDNVYFYEGLLMIDKSMIDAASGGAPMDKTPAVARHLILNMANIGKPIDITHIFGEVARCRPASTSPISEAVVPAESKSSVAYNTKVWTSRDHARSESGQLSTIGTMIPGATIPPTTTSTNATMGEQSGNGGLDFTISRKHNCDYTRFKNADGITSRHSKPNAIGQFRNGFLLEDFESNKSVTPHPSPQSAEVEAKPGSDSQLQQPTKNVLLSFLNRVFVTKRSEIDEDLLKLFKKVEINILLLDTIKQIP
ncbi:hypothetical protein CR513_10894, partial [Mucuna pruriens]